MVSYQRYSHHARRALTHAELLVARYHHPRVDTAHLLVGVLLTKGSIGCAVLKDLGLWTEDAEAHLAALTLSSNAPSDRVNYDAALDAALDLAADEASWLGQHYIGTEHLLLGITRTNLGNASDLLRMLQISPEQVRRRVRRAVKEGETEFTLQLLRRNVRFSELSRRVLNAAEQLAISFDHPTVGIGHLLLALSTEPRGQAALLLRNSGLNAERLRYDLHHQHELALLTSVEELLNQALELSEEYSHHYTGTEHLILTLTTYSAGSALLRGYNVNIEALATSADEQLRRSH